MNIEAIDLHIKLIEWDLADKFHNLFSKVNFEFCNDWTVTGNIKATFYLDGEVIGLENLQPEEKYLLRWCDYTFESKHVCNDFGVGFLFNFVKEQGRLEFYTNN